MPASEPGRNHIMVPVLELRDISKGYADGRGVRTEVLKSINLSVGSGEFVAILGFSGTGKTTLISLMAGLINADSGEIVVNGRPSAGSGSDRGLVFQSYSLMPWLSVAANVRLAVDAVHKSLYRSVRARRSEERRLGKECVSTCGSRGWLCQ